MRREELYLADLLDNARAVRGYLDGVTRERWDTDGMLRDAVLYRMMPLGEIASALPDDLRDRHPDVAWRQIRAFRNLAVHRYFGVDWAVVWKIAQEEPSVLEKQALAIITAPRSRQRQIRAIDVPGGRSRAFLPNGLRERLAPAPHSGLAATRASTCRSAVSSRCRLAHNHARRSRWPRPSGCTRIRSRAIRSARAVAMRRRGHVRGPA
jgi:uncharacterized protein with HEPN domain